MKKEEMSDHLTIDDLCDRWNLVPGTLSNWRVKGIGPKHVKVGRTILYPVSEVEAYEMLQIKRSTVG